MSDSVTYTAALPFSRESVEHVAAALHQHRRDLGTRRGRRALGCFAQAVAFLRWMLDGTAVSQLATDNAISLKTTYRYVHEALGVLAGQAPSLEGALLAAQVAGYSHVALDGTLVRTDRVAVPGPTPATSRKNSGPKRAKVDLFWSGKHKCHGGNVQVLTAPDGWPLWVSPVRPGREHDTTCARAHEDLLATLDAWSDPEHPVLTDLGYEGESNRLVCPIKNDHDLDEDERSFNAAHSATRALAERGNALLKTTFKALRRVTVCPWRIGTIAAAALVLLHLEHHRTT